MLYKRRIYCVPYRLFANYSFCVCYSKRESCCPFRHAFPPNKSQRMLSRSSKTFVENVKNNVIGRSFLSFGVISFLDFGFFAQKYTKFQTKPTVHCVVLPMGKIDQK